MWGKNQRCAQDKIFCPVLCTSVVRLIDQKFTFRYHLNYTLWPLLKIISFDREEMLHLTEVNWNKKDLSYIMKKISYQSTALEQPLFSTSNGFINKKVKWSVKKEIPYVFLWSQLKFEGNFPLSILTFIIQIKNKQRRTNYCTRQPKKKKVNSLRQDIKTKNIGKMRI